MSARTITLRGVRVHNLKDVDLDLPHGRLIVFCGVSGSGKTSLALDTLYTEGQRRYLETFSAYTRQFLERLEKPAADKLDGIPAAIAVTHKNASRSNRSTIATSTEIYDYLRLLYAKLGQVVCHSCGQPVRRDTPQGAAELVQSLPAGARLLIAFPQPIRSAEQLPETLAAWREKGFVRAIVGGRTLHAESDPLERWREAAASATVPPGETSGEAPIAASVVVDRLTAGALATQRLRDSLELAFREGQGLCQLFVIAEGSPDAGQAPGTSGTPVALDGQSWRRIGLSNRFRCEECGIDYTPPEPRLFSFNNALGACPTCEGFGDVVDVDMKLVVPDPSKTLVEGAIAPWTTPSYAHELAELLALAPAYGVPTDVPYRDLTEEHRRLLWEGVPERKFGGLSGFFDWLERRKYKIEIRVFLSRWKSSRVCPDCRGQRLRPEARAVRIGGRNIAELVALDVAGAAEFFTSLPLAPSERRIAKMLLDQVTARLGFLAQVGLSYLTLDRTLKTLSGGEAQRVALTAALGSNLVSMMYVLDEPSVGLHPGDVEQLLVAIERLRDRGNTVVVVEHEETILRAADELIEIGPAAGERGGRVVFQGTPDQCQAPGASATGDFLAGRRGISVPERRREPTHGRIILKNARGNNLQNLTVEFPLGLLCLVTGVSGAGKSTLVEETLYPALCRRLRKEVPVAAPYDDLLGEGQINDVVLVDQSPIGRSPRSNPVTYIKAFDEIRGVFADTIEARTRNFTASHFSFNVDGGRCEACHGDGYVTVDMQFLADVYMKCPTCRGARYRKEILAVTYRGRSIAEVLEMTVREAFSFFRGQQKVQARLKSLIDVGLDYLRLGQPAGTLSGGEAQRLKLAAYLTSVKRGRTLFILDEPTTGLHFADVVRLLDAFEALLDVGHSLIVVEHNLQVMKGADWIIDLGPGAAQHGGRIVCAGPPETIAEHPDSITGRFLAEALARQPAEVEPGEAPPESEEKE